MNATTHVVFRPVTFSDAGSTPAASTNIYFQLLSGYPSIKIPVFQASGMIFGRGSLLREIVATQQREPEFLCMCFWVPELKTETCPPIIVIH
jgi:hypothetical protein